MRSLSLERQRLKLDISEYQCYNAENRFQQVCELSLLRLHNCGTPVIMWLHMFQIQWNVAACWRLIWLKLDTSTTFGPCKIPASRLNSFPFLQTDNIKIKYPGILAFMIQLLDFVDLNHLNLNCLKFTQDLKVHLLLVKSLNHTLKLSLTICQLLPLPQDAHRCCECIEVIQINCRRSSCAHGLEVEL